MSNLLTTLKLWSKIVLLVGLGAFLTAFLYQNWGKRVEVDLVFAKVGADLLLVLLLTCLCSIIGWWLLKVILRTARQFREAQHRARTERLEREVAEMKAKAASLQKGQGEKRG